MRPAAQAGEKLPDIPGKYQEHCGKYGQYACQGLEQNTAGIRIDIHVNLLSNIGKLLKLTLHG